MAEQESKDSGGAAVAEQVLSIMEIILDESNAEPLSEDKVGGPVCPSAGLSRCQPLAYLGLAASSSLDRTFSACRDGN